MEGATNRHLHAPPPRRRPAAGGSDGNDLVRAAKHLFDLPEAPADVEEGEKPLPEAETSEKRLPH